MYMVCMCLLHVHVLCHWVHIVCICSLCVIRVFYTHHTSTHRSLCTVMRAFMKWEGGSDTTGWADYKQNSCLLQGLLLLHILNILFEGTLFLLSYIPTNVHTHDARAHICCAHNTLMHMHTVYKCKQYTYAFTTYTPTYLCTPLLHHKNAKSV